MPILPFGLSFRASSAQQKAKEILASEQPDFDPDPDYVRKLISERDQWRRAYYHVEKKFYAVKRELRTVAELRAACSWSFVFGKKEGAVWKTQTSSHLLSWGMAKQMADQLGEVILGHIAWFADDTGKGHTNPDLHPEETKQVELMLDRLAEGRGYDVTG